MKGKSFSELEQFALDVQRQYVLNLPESNVRAIIDGRLKQWQTRYAIEVPELSEHEEDKNG